MINPARFLDQKQIGIISARFIGSARRAFVFHQSCRASLSSEPYLNARACAWPPKFRAFEPCWENFDLSLRGPFAPHAKRRYRSSPWTTRTPEPEAGELPTRRELRADPPIALSGGAPPLQSSLAMPFTRSPRRRGRGSRAGSSGRAWGGGCPAPGRLSPRPSMRDQRP